MATPVQDELWALTEKEKQTLRLIVRGHDAKSSARTLGLSVHTINERLRDARRKMAVSSSREAARMLLQAEAGGAGYPDPELLRDATIGEDAARLCGDRGNASVGGAGRTRRPWIIIGGCLMTFALACLVLVAMPQGATAPASPAVDQETPDPEVVDTARQWLALLDRADWEGSYRLTSTAFRALNTAQVWGRASERVRTPLGAMVSRTFASQENLPAPPHGYEVVKFRTRFANKVEAVETVTLDRERDGWRISGVTVG